MRHPLEAALRTHTRRVFVAALVATLVLLGVLSVIDAPLKTPEAPLGIISFELSWDAATARAIVASWSPRARERAVQSLRVDFLFIPAYATAIALGVLWAGGLLVGSGWMGRPLATRLAWGQGLAALLDVIENVALLAVLRGPATEALTRVAAASAVVKFALVAAGLLYAGIGGAAWLARR